MTDIVIPSGCEESFPSHFHFFVRGDSIRQRLSKFYSRSTMIVLPFWQVINFSSEKNLKNSRC